MFEETRPAPLGPDGDAGALSAFGVNDPFEVRAILKDLMDRGAIVNLNGSDSSVYGTTLWSVDTTQRRIGFSADVGSPMVERLVEADEAVAVAYLDRIKIQFDVSARMLVHGRGGSVLQADLPRVVYRFQRRNAFRVRTLERSAPQVKLRHPEIPDMTLSLRVLDLSISGCALFLPQDVPLVQPGSLINGVQVELDEGTRFSCALRVHHVTAIQPESRGVRLGCEMIQLGRDAERALQLYIDQTQKRRRMMALD